MTHFTVNDSIYFECVRKKTRMAFKHEGYISVRGQITHAKICYQNRTWESFEYESLLQKLADRAKLSADDHRIVMRFITGYSEPSPFGALVGVAKLGEIFGNTSKEKTDWKVRMLKAGLGDSMSLPDDWNSLPDDVKAARIDAAIAALK
jgi:hypothetical protein